MNTLLLRQVPTSETLGHGASRRRHRNHELYINGELIRVFRENSQLDNYCTGKSYDALVDTQVEKFEKALETKVVREDRSHWTPAFKVKAYELAFGPFEELEWSGTKEGQGDGPHSSGPGPLFDACPVCRGLKEPNGHFTDEAVDHRDNCELAAMLEGKSNE